MQKVSIDRPGGWERLKVIDAPDPVPGPGEVLIEVKAAGVNFADVIVRLGLYESAKVYVGWPITPGFEVAGRVAAVGSGVVLGPNVGDSVFAVTRFGGYASRVCVPAHQAFPIPAGFSLEQAAAFPTVHLTAWWALHELAHPRAGGVALVHSAAGGVGLALCSLLRIAGLTVVGVVGNAGKAEAARVAGADVVLVRGPDLWDRVRAASPRGYDLVLDASGPETLKQSYAHLAPGGKLVVYGFHSMFRRGGGARPSVFRLLAGLLRTPRFSPLAMTGENRSVMAFNLSYLFERSDLLALGMGDLLGWLGDGRLAPPTVESFAFADVAQAHARLESGETVGKLVLKF